MSFVELSYDEAIDIYGGDVNGWKIAGGALMIVGGAFDVAAGSKVGGAVAIAGGVAAIADGLT